MPNKSASLLRNLLRPAARFAIRRGIKIRTILEELKTTLLEEAHRELSRVEQEPSTSRLSVMTGLQRKDVQKVLGASDEPPRNTDLMTKIIGLWSASDSFSSNGAPNSLPLDDSDYSFGALVRSVSQDINPSTVLFELERLKLIKKEANAVHLLWNCYQVSGDIDDAYALLSSDIETLIRGVDRNISHAGRTPNLHVSTSFDNVSTEALGQIKDWILERGARFHAEVRDYVGSFDKDLNPTLHAKSGGGRVTVGSFSLCTEPEASDD